MLHRLRGPRQFLRVLILRPYPQAGANALAAHRHSNLPTAGFHRYGVDYRVSNLFAPRFRTQRQYRTSERLPLVFLEYLPISTLHSDSLTSSDSDYQYQRQFGVEPGISPLT